MNIFSFVMVLFLVGTFLSMQDRIDKLERTAKSSYGCSTGITVVTSLNPPAYTSICR